MVDLKIINVRGFNLWNADYICSEIMEVEITKQPAHIFEITSFGGYAFCLQKILDTMSSCKKPTLAVASGACASCGSIFFNACDYRLIGPNSTMLLHEPSGMTWGKYSDMKSDIKDTENLTKWMYSLYDKNSNKPTGYFEKLVFDNNNADLVLTADECVQHSLVDGKGSLIDIIKDFKNISSKVQKRNE